MGAGLSDAIAVAGRHALDQAMEPKPSKVVGHCARGIGGRIASLELRDLIAQFPMPEASRGEREETQRMHERVDAAGARRQDAPMKSRLALFRFRNRSVPNQKSVAKFSDEHPREGHEPRKGVVPPSG